MSSCTRLAVSVAFVLLLSTQALASQRVSQLKDHLAPRPQLCYGAPSSNAGAGHVKCAVDLQYVSMGLFQQGPKLMPVGQIDPVPERISAFIRTFCHEFRDDKSSRRFRCPVYVGADATIVMMDVNEAHDSWSLFGSSQPQPEACVSWTVDGSMVSSVILRGTTPYCPHPGSVYALVCLGVASLLKVNVAGINDLARLPCGAQGSVPASLMFLLAKGKFFYESMIGPLYHPMAADQKVLAKAREIRQQIPSAEAQAALRGLYEHYIPAPKQATWAHVAQVWLDQCKAKTLPPGTTAALPLLLSQGQDLAPLKSTVVGVHFNVVTTHDRSRM